LEVVLRSGALRPRVVQLVRRPSPALKLPSSPTLSSPRAGSSGAASNANAIKGVAIAPFECIVSRPVIWLFPRQLRDSSIRAISRSPMKGMLPGAGLREG
jgi:hypothetical protein